MKVKPIEMQTKMATNVPKRHANGMQHPIILPSFRCRPERVNGIPSCRESFPLAEDRPIARFHDHAEPNFLPRPAIPLAS